MGALLPMSRKELKARAEAGLLESVSETVGCLARITKSTRHTVRDQWPARRIASECSIARAPGHLQYDTIQSVIGSENTKVNLVEAIAGAGRIFRCASP